MWCRVSCLCGVQNVMYTFCGTFLMCFGVCLRCASFDIVVDWLRLSERVNVNNGDEIVVLGGFKYNATATALVETARNIWLNAIKIKTTKYKANKFSFFFFYLYLVSSSSFAFEKREKKQIFIRYYVYELANHLLL